MLFEGIGKVQYAGQRNAQWYQAPIEAWRNQSLQAAKIISKNKKQNEN